MIQEQAETIALQALAYLAQNQELLDRFLQASGLSLQEVRSHFQEPEFLGGVLDVILKDDKILLDFCNTISISPETLIHARRGLPGGYEVYGSESSP